MATNTTDSGSTLIIVLADVSAGGTEANKLGKNCFEKNKAEHAATVTTHW